MLVIENWANKSGRNCSCTLLAARIALHTGPEFNIFITSPSIFIFYIFLNKTTQERRDDLCDIHWNDRFRGKQKFFLFPNSHVMCFVLFHSHNVSHTDENVWQLHKFFLLQFLKSNHRELFILWIHSVSFVTRSSATAKSTARPSCLVGVLYVRETINRSTANQLLLRNCPRKLPISAKQGKILAITTFKVIQGHRFEFSKPAIWPDGGMTWTHNVDERQTNEQTHR